MSATIIPFPLPFVFLFSILYQECLVPNTNLNDLLLDKTL